MHGGPLICGHVGVREFLFETRNHGESRSRMSRVSPGLRREMPHVPYVDRGPIWGALSRIMPLALVLGNATPGRPH